MSDLIGKTLGPYRILEQIGVGGMATVYKAYQPSMDRDVAIKILPHYLSQDAEFAKRFQREARAIARLEHAHILPVYDYGEADDITYIAMRYVQAGTLKERIARGPLPLDEINRLVGQIGSALDYAHRLGIIHRDVKPSNVLIDDQGNTYLTDFGLARMMESSQQLTASGVGVGTPAYMSPEQGQGIKVDHRSDIYSLGVVLYEMVTGHVPYEAETPMGVVLKHISDPLPLPRKLAPNVPEGVEKVILRALAKDPAHRFQTACEMVEALNLAVRKAAPEPARPVAVEAAPSGASISFVTRVERVWEKPRGKFALVGGAVVVLVVLGLLLSQLPGRVQIAAPGPALSTAEGVTATGVVAPTTGKTAQPTTAPTATAIPATPASAAAPAAQCRIAYSEKTGTNINDIYVTDCDGSNLRRVTEGRISTGHEPAWSPDGQRLVFDENQNLEFDTVPAYLYIINADGTNRTQIVAPDGTAEGDFPVWSPDGSRIAWKYGCEIMTIRPDGSGMVTVLDHRELSGAGDPEMCANRPMWSPDSQRFAFTTFPLAAHHDPTIPGPYESRFYVVNADGTGLTELASFQLAYPRLGGVADVNVFWLPNGRQVALEVSEGERTRRYQMNADGSGEMVEIDSIPESWRPWYWPQWSGEAQTTLSPQAAQARAFAEPILQAVADRKPDFEDDFSTAGKGWSGGNLQPGESAVVQNGVARLEVKEKDASFGNEALNRKDFVLQLDARVAEGDKATQLIVHFHNLSGEYWFYLVVHSAGNTWLVDKHVPGDQRNLANGSGNVSPFGEKTRIMIVARGPRAAIYLNGTPVAYFEDADFDTSGGTGLFCQSLGQAVCEFDNVKFWNLNNVPGLP